MNTGPQAAIGRAMRARTVDPDHDPNPARRIGINALCDLCGGVSQMTIWRWQADPTLDFPKPIYIGRRRYWREAEIIAWLEARAEVA